MRPIRGVLFFILTCLCGWGCGGGEGVVLSKASFTFWEREVDALRPGFVDLFSREKVLLEVGSFLLVASPLERRYFEQVWDSEWDGPGEYATKLYRVDKDGSRRLCGLRLGVKSSWAKKSFGFDLGGVDKSALKGLEEIVFLVDSWFDKKLLEKKIVSILEKMDTSKVMVTIQSCGGGRPEVPEIPKDVRFLRVLGAFSSYSGIGNAAGLRYLGIWANGSGGGDPGVIRSLKSLEFLDLRGLDLNYDLKPWNPVSALRGRGFCFFLMP